MVRINTIFGIYEVNGFIGDILAYISIAAMIIGYGFYCWLIIEWIKSALKKGK